LLAIAFLCTATSAVANDCTAEDSLVSCQEAVVVKPEDLDPGQAPRFLETYLFEGMGTKSKRITDSSLYADSNKRAGHSYSRRQAWNADESLIDVGVGVISADSFALVYDAVALTTERNWSNLDAGKMFGIRTVSSKPNVFGALTLSSGEFESYLTLDDYERCTLGDGEGNLSNDDQFVVLTCAKADKSKDLISYNLLERKILGTMPALDTFNWASFSQSGRYIVVENNILEGGESEVEELIRYEPDFTQETLLTNDRNHGDLGVDDLGQDVFVMIDWYRVSYIVLKTGERVRLGIADRARYPGHGHVSCRNIHRPGWCYLSGNDSSAVGAFRVARDPSLLAWVKARFVKTKPGVSAYEPWGFHFSTAKSYDSQPKISASPSGKQVIFSSDWMGSDATAEYVISVE